MHAAASLQAAEMPRARKYLAWGHKLLGDIALLEERMEEARREYQAALDVLGRHPSPTIEWQILTAMAGAARHAKSDSTNAVGPAGVIANQARYLIVVKLGPLAGHVILQNELVYVACTQRDKLLR